MAIKGFIQVFPDGTHRLAETPHVTWQTCPHSWGPDSYAEPATYAHIQRTCNYCGAIKVTCLGKSAACEGDHGIFPPQESR